MRDEYLRRRLWRKLQSLPDERLYQVVDYVEFLGAKYGEAASEPDRIQRIAEGVQDRMRDRRGTRWAFRGVMGALGVVDRAVGTAARAVRGLNEEMTDLKQRGTRSRPTEELGGRTTKILVE